MSRFGTDILALTCILGGAAVSGAVTMAVAQRADAGPDRSEYMSIRCVEERAEAPMVRVTSGRSDRTIVVRTSKRSPVATCDGVVSIRRKGIVVIPSSRVPPSADMVRELERRLELAQRQRAGLDEQREVLERVRAQLREAEVAVEVVRIQERKRERERR